MSRIQRLVIGVCFAGLVSGVVYILLYKSRKDQEDTTGNDALSLLDINYRGFSPTGGARAEFNWLSLVGDSNIQDYEVYKIILLIPKSSGDSSIIKMKLSGIGYRSSMREGFLAFPSRRSTNAIVCTAEEDREMNEYHHLGPAEDICFGEIAANLGKRQFVQILEEGAFQLSIRSRSRVFTPRYDWRKVSEKLKEQLKTAESGNKETVGVVLGYEYFDKAWQNTVR